MKYNLIEDLGKEVFYKGKIYVIRGGTSRSKKYIIFNHSGNCEIRIKPRYLRVKRKEKYLVTATQWRYLVASNAPPEPQGRRPRGAQTRETPAKRSQAPNTGKKR